MQKTYAFFIEKHKLLLGGLALIPFIQWVGFLFLGLASTVKYKYSFYYFSKKDFQIFAVIHLLANIIGVPCLVLMITHAIKNRLSSSTKQMIWITSLLGINFYIMPFYWYFNICRGHRGSTHVGLLPK